MPYSPGLRCSVYSRKRPAANLTDCDHRPIELGFHQDEREMICQNGNDFTDGGTLYLLISF